MKKTEKAREILAGLQAIKPPLTAEGDLDVLAINRLPVVRDAILALRACGYHSTKDLMQAGFIAAGLVLKY